MLRYDILHKVCPQKFIKVNIHSQESIKNFQDILINLDIISKLDKSLTANPNVNYNNLHDLTDNTTTKWLDLININIKSLSRSQVV